MDQSIGGSERLAIFIVNSDDIKEDGAHWRAFMPGKDEERSFFRIDGLDLADIAQIGKEVALQRGKILRGWAILRAEQVLELAPLQLKIDEPPKQHGVIVGWPNERHERVSLCQSLADIAETVQWCMPPER